MHSNGSAYGAPAPAVSSKRMTYGAINSNTREARERQELFAGADPYRSPYQQQQQQQMPEQELNNEQLLEQAKVTHQDTTATARRALQVLEQTKEIQGNTAAALVDQRQQMYRIEDGLDKMGQDLTYSERILRFMKLCCCFGFFCSCCTEPARANSDRKWRGSGPPPAGYEPDSPPQQQSIQQRGKQQQQQRQPGSAAYPGVSTHGLEDAGYGQQAAAIDAETQQQNQYLDQISQGLDQLKFGAQRMNDELQIQDRHAENIRQDADTLQYKLHSVNKEGFRRV